MAFCINCHDEYSETRRAMGFVVCGPCHDNKKPQIRELMQQYLVAYPDLVHVDRKLYEMLKYWLILKTQSPDLPNTDDLKFKGMLDILPNTWQVKVFYKPLRLRCQGLGSNVVKSFGGRNNTGKYLDELYSKKMYEHIKVPINKVISTQAPQFALEINRNHNFKKYARSQRIYLPLGRNQRVDTILGCSVFFDHNGKELFTN